jgi:hypothetical protein
MLGTNQTYPYFPCHSIDASQITIASLILLFLPITLKMHTHTATLLPLFHRVPQVCIGPEVGSSLRESSGLSFFHAVVAGLQMDFPVQMTISQ